MKRKVLSESQSIALMNSFLSKDEIRLEKIIKFAYYRIGPLGGLQLSEIPGAYRICKSGLDAGQKLNDVISRFKWKSGGNLFGLEFD